MLKYEVLKEFVYTMTGREYNVGEIFETNDSVKGLVNRGILRLKNEEVSKPVELPCDPKEQIKDKLNKSRTYLKDTKITELTKGDLDIVVSERLKEFRDDVDLETKFDLQLSADKMLDKYMPAANLKRTKKNLTSKVDDASKSIKTKRTTKNIEVDLSSTNLVESLEEDSGISKLVKSVKSSKTTRTPKVKV